MRRLPIVPASFFSIVLGTIGLGISWRVQRLWELPGGIGEGFIWLGIVVWAVLAALYVFKWVAAPGAAKAEIADPVQCCFVGLAGVATMLAGLGLLPYSEGIAALLYALGAIFTLGFGIWRTGLLWRGGRPEAATTPVLYLPLVAGSFVVSDGLSAFGYPDWGQLAFGAGFFTWLAIESVLLRRLYTEPLSEALRPTLGIQLAPPAVGALAYVNATSGAGDILVHAFIGYAVLQALLLARMMPWIARRFAPSLWAFSFGATALASASLVLASRGDAGAIAVVAVVGFVVANLLVVGLIVGTVALLVAGKLLPAPLGIAKP
ncbi:MAG: dicarboxylate transporter/tellurite-resistance protein TehA [Devosia sp.]|uniref:dicarboxylate transporter/tellurite-resistance protein TehA n=1 Tax=Devosia sp. TaxID=1871048 RepID=UPI002609199B|nr:dicarboxylate transporter/tellurite-resistance protein TehA [Devosia sp.]MDB5539711.1 dicarboxylate transporter/tellurite-resistance protein TehA [Devosia sp.]